MNLIEKISLKKKNIEKRKSVVDTDDYVKNFDYRGITKEEAQLVLHNAEEKYNLLVHDVEYLDNKADLLIKYLGLLPPGLAAIIGYLAPSKCLHLPWPALVGIIVGIITWIAAIVLALGVVKPTDMPYPPTIQNLFQKIVEKKNWQLTEAVLALKYEQVIARLKELGNIKGARLKRGYVLIIVSILLLLFSLIVGNA